MRNPLLLLVLPFIVSLGCNQENRLTDSSLAVGGTALSWPQCSLVNRDQLNANTMYDSQPTCVSCDLISPCSQTDGASFSWYTPEICVKCAFNCPVTTSVGAYCTYAFGGACADSGSYYSCGAGNFIPKGVYAAYGSYPIVYGTDKTDVYGIAPIVDGGCTAWGQNTGQSQRPQCRGNFRLPTL